MRVGILLVLWASSAFTGCGGSQTIIGSSLGEKPDGDAPPPKVEPSQKPVAPSPPGAKATQEAVAQDAEPAPPPPPDPALVRALVDKTGEPSALDNPLHVRLEVTPRPAGELWLVAVVNRGTEPAAVLFDLRRLTIALENPEDPSKPRPRWQKKPAPVVCRLPEGFGGQVLDVERRVLEPGEGLLQTFDPRLYCISPNGDALLATGQIARVKLGFPAKPPRVVYKQGKRTEVPQLQSAPFVAEPGGEAAPAKVDPEHDLRVKELAASDLTLTPELLAGEAEEDPTLPLKLVLTRGSDAGTEMNATATVKVQAKQKAQVYFRRELVSFTVHAPDGIRTCDPQPDDRAPDRQAYSTLGAGQSIVATSMLAELCPKYTFGRPGLYLVTARMDAARDGSEFGFSAFTGRLESQREAVVRIRTGEMPALPPPQPIAVKVGQ